MENKKAEKKHLLLQLLKSKSSMKKAIILQTILSTNHFNEWVLSSPKQMTKTDRKK